MSRRGTEGRLGKATSDVASRPGWLRGWAGRVAHALGLSVLAFGSFGIPPSHAATPAGYAEYIVPFDEDIFVYVTDPVVQSTILASDTTATFISVTAWADNVKLYYDHWENGYVANLADNPTSADETYSMSKGETLVFSSATVPRPRTGADGNTYIGNPGNCTGQAAPKTPDSRTTTNYCYDGRDRFITVGGATTVTRGGYINHAAGGVGDPALGIPAAIGEEVYPLQPQLNKYIVPFGEDATRTDYNRVMVVIQATEDNTTLQIDFNADGTYDGFNPANGYRTARTTCAPGCLVTQTTLQRGQAYILDQDSDGTLGGTLPKGIVILGSNTLQVEYFYGQSNSNPFDTRAVSAYPRGFWNNEYYAPAGGAAAGDTDVLVHNPSSSAITVNWESTSGSGSFTLNALETSFFQAKTGGYVPQGSALYLKGSGVFWGTSDIDTNSGNYDWGYSLVPSYLLQNDQHVSWAPGNSPVLACNVANGRGNGLYITPVQDNTTFFIDKNGDGVPDTDASMEVLNGATTITATGSGYRANRLQSLYITGSNSGTLASSNCDLSGAHIWATGPFALAYGENPDKATTIGGLDLGYTALPSPANWMDLALTVQKATNPVVLSTTANPATTTYTLTVNSVEFSIDGVRVLDTLAADWTYTVGTDTTTITLPNGSTVNTNPTVTAAGAALPAEFGGTCPAGGGSCLTWGSSVLNNMAPNQTITIVFTARTVGTPSYASGDLSRNLAQATATRTVGGVTQTFKAEAFVFNTYLDSTVNMTVTKSSSPTESTPVSPGDTITYTVGVSNPVGSTGYLTGVSLYDALPLGVTYVAGSGQITSRRADIFLDKFEASPYYSNNADNFPAARTWRTNWTELNDGANNETTGSIQAVSDTGVTPNRRVLQVAGNTNAIQAYIARGLNLSTYSSAVLSFDYRYSGLDNASDWVDVQICQTAVTPTTCTAGGWTTVTRIGGLATYPFAGGTMPSYASYTYTLPATYLTANFALRFVESSNANMLTNDIVYFDNVKVVATPTTISSTQSGTFASSDPPDFVSAKDGYVIAPGGSLTLTFSVTVDNPFPTNLSEIINTGTARANEIPIPLSASARNIVNTPSQQNAQVNGTVWLDANGNTTIDVGEARLSNVEVTLKDQWGTPIAVTTTDSQGHYLFTNIVPGNGYYTEVTGGLPSGLSQTAPSGHTDNRSNAFNLSAGGNVTDVNLGYRGTVGTATIGDTVWSDANGNGVQDPGEPGIAGVTVRLYTDTNGNGIIDGGETYITTTTGPGGTYLFTGVAAGQNYIVNIPSGQSVLSGYTATNPVTDHLGFLNVAANTAYLTADFGFRNASTTYTITDRVWYDANGNGSLDGGETGIAGVTVDLLDNSGNVIATTTTDANGNVSFTGLANGTYRLRVTDSGNKLGDYYGTTTYAQNALRTGIIVNGGNVSNTSFGYNLSRAIGDTVFNDSGAGGGTAGNGVQDGSEPGISGVTVLLYRDANGNSTFEPGTDTLVGTLTTDANGHYLFTGLTSGTYWVSIDGTQTALSGFTTLTTSDDVPAQTGDQRVVTTLSNLNIDYGYRATTSYSISGRLWNDVNDNGADNSEAGLANVTIQLLQGGTVIGSTTTDANGNYSFTGLPAGTYTVKVTDSNGVLVGYNTTYEKTEGALAGSYNGQEAVTLGPSVSNVNFAYYKPKPTLASISDFSATVEQGRVVVQWVTEFEIGTVGFQLERWNPVLGVFERITPSMLPGLITSPQGGTYEYADPGARPDESATYRLIEIEAWGTQRVHGPYTVTPSASAPARVAAAARRVGKSSFGGQGHDDPRRGYRATPHALKPKTKGSRNSLLGLATKAPASVTHALWVTVTPSGAAQVKVREDGLFLVSSSNLAKAFNASEPTVRGWIAQGRIKLSNAGQAVAWTAAPGNAGILFYGQAIDSLYTLDNVYRVEPVAGNKMMTSVGTPSASQPAGVFTETLKFEQDKFAATIVATDPESDYWFWEGFQGDTPKWISKTFTLDVPDVMGGGSLAIGFSGAAATEHAVEIWLNSHYVGTGSWSGLEAYVLSLPVDGSMLQSGANSVEVRALGTSENMFYLDRFQLTYQRRTRAVGDRLTLRAAKSGPVAVDGFSVPAISVFDITNPQLPLRLNGTKIVGTGAGYSVTFQAKKGCRYLAVAATAILAATAQAESGTNLKGQDRVDYAVITTPTLAGAAQALADYRKTTSLKARVVLVDDIYTNFNFGIANPHALGNFLRQAARNWGLRYAVLAGVGTLDYRDLLGFAEEQVPTLMTSTPYGLYACDGCLGDFDGDGVPEVVVSRIPAGSVGDLQAYVAKLKTYGQGKMSLGAAGVLMLADAADPNAGDFPADSDSVAALLPLAVGVDKVYLSDYDLATARTLMFGRLEGDLGWLNYIGHGNIDRMTSGGLMTTADVGGLQSTGMLPVVSALTCAVNRFEIPGYASLGEELVLQPHGGAIAAWAPTGLSLDASAVQLDESLFKLVFQSEAPVLGDAVRRSLRDNSGIPLFIRRIYNLLGDGALRLRH